MASVIAYHQGTIPGKPTTVKIRLLDGRNHDYKGRTSIKVLPEWWDDKKGEIKARLLLPAGQSRDQINASIKAAKDLVEAYYVVCKENLPDKWITRLLAEEIKLPTPKNADPTYGLTFFDLLEQYKKSLKVSEGRQKHVVVVIDMLQRFQTITGVDMDIHTLSEETLTDFENFLREEHTFYENYKALYPDLYPNKLRIKPRGQNTLNSKLKIFRAFLKWTKKKKYTKNDPFDSYTFSPDVYGDPIPLLPEEVDFLYKQKDLPKDLQITRDLFCLQCYCGARVGDFMNLRRENLDGDLLVYIPEKTIGEQPATVYVPLAPKALDIIKRYGFPDGRLMPAINVNGKDGYNKKIKELLRKVGLTRSVVVINTVTRKPEIKQLCDVVSTHTARKTFANSNYMETQDPKLIAKMTGHSPGSRAFERYRDIDIETLRKQISKTFGEEE